MIYREINKNLVARCAVVLLVGLLFSGCGFKPRGSGYGHHAGQTVLLLSKDPYGLLERRIRERLIRFDIITEGGVQQSNNDNTKPIENNSIRINSIKLQKEVISVDINGRPAEYENQITVDTSFHYSAKQNQINQFSVQRDYRYDSTNNLAHDRELEILTLEMYDNLAIRIVDSYLRELSAQSTANET